MRWSHAHEIPTNQLFWIWSSSRQCFAISGLPTIHPSELEVGKICGVSQDGNSEGAPDLRRGFPTQIAKQVKRGGVPLPSF